MYVERFHENALDSCDLVAEEALVGVCLDGILEAYRILMEIFSFSTFSRLMETER